jgi:hypothetical protein
VKRAQAIYGHVVEDDGTKHTPIYSLGRSPYQVQAKQYVAMGGIQFVFRHRLMMYFQSTLSQVALVACSSMQTPPYVEDYVKMNFYLVGKM